ncbi:tubulin-folding cofactor D-like [Phalaenopsis equestris]|uniref:tubulin-folding cofactor D-like n=1 Tax=Phalaenopsis equestris TaxID=78828 RepID=UPI0009E3385F|nr:tubulin-folding cofactor D-like [Phalaenopsis equestris]
MFQDRSLRELAARAISALAKYDPDYFAGSVLEKLMPFTLSVDLCTRHGATLAVGELVLALHECKFHFSMEKQQKVAGIVPSIEKARLYRGKGGEIMRSAVSKLIDCISSSAISLNDKTKKILLETLTDNLKHPNSQIQNAAVDALRNFVQAYLVSVNEKVPNGIVSTFLELLDDPNVAARRGAALAFGILPYEFLFTRWREILRKLCKSCLLRDQPDDADAEARVNAVKGLVTVCETLTRASSDQSTEESSIYIFIRNDVMRTLFDALDDYAVDNRGDVGSWVREAAMDALERCAYILCKYDESVPSKQLCPLFDEKIATDLVKGIAKQAVEKMDKIRGAAARILQRIIHCPLHFVPCIPHRKTLEEVIPLDTDLKWENPTVSFPRFVQLLQFSCYSRSLLSGYVISVGGLQESLSKASKEALLEFIDVSEGYKIQNSNNREFMLSTDLLGVLQNNQKCNRIILPTMKTIEILFSRKVFLNMEGHTLDFCTGLLDSLAVELKGTKDFTKLYTGISMLGYVASVTEPLNCRALAQLIYFLGHRYPKIRKAAADQVYLVLLQNTTLMDEEKVEKFVEIVTETSWDGPLEDSKQTRLQLLELAGFANTKITFSTHRETGKASFQDISGTDENMSYSSLVDFTGF